MAQTPFVRSNLREQIKDLIQQRIVEGDYPPGMRLVETRIAQELGVSQAPVREALRDLEQLGSVVYEPYRGCSVRSVSPEELLEAYPVRAALEALAAELAAGRIEADELDRLSDLIDQMHEAEARGDAAARNRANAAFHATIVRAAGNATLESSWRLLEPFSRTSLSASQPDLDKREMTEKHRPVVEALRVGDGKAAAKAMYRHLMDAAELLRRTLRDA